MNEQRPAGRLTVYLLGAVIVIGAVLLGLGVWLLGSRTSNDNNAEPATVAEESEPATAEQTASNEPAPDDPSVTVTDDSSGEGEFGAETIRRSSSSPVILVRGETPQGWRIESPDGYGFYPVEPAGPAVFTDTQSSGFAQSPEGAGFAAIHILQRINPLNPNWRTAAEGHLVGAGAAVYVEGTEALAATDEDRAALRDASALKNAWVGWSVLEFDPQQAMFQLAGLGSLDEQEVRFTLNVRLEWLDQDWRLVASETDLSDLVDFVPVVDHGELDIDMRDAFAL